MMPGKEHNKPHAAVTVAESVGILETDPHFGDTITVVWTSADPSPVAYVQVQGPEGGLGQYVTLYGDGADPHVTLGPTPTWSSGGGSGSVSLLSWRDQGPAVDVADYILLAGPVPFTVLP